MKERDKPLLLILLKRAAILLWVVCAVSIFYWAIGSVRSFLDETELMLLDIARISSLGVIATAVIGLVFMFIYALSGRFNLRIKGLAGYVLVAAFGALALVLSQTMTILSRGLR
jgi:hypothetical protein